MGFIRLHTEKLDDIDAAGHVYRHISGARLAFIQNTDENKVFSATFKTPVSDDTGVAHIVEHCLFCGSKKYRAKDPFNELAKGSLNTYLNAMTFRDKTMYPVASCNEKDFHNLMDVYLDAVFAPLIGERKQTFLQEGRNLVLDGDSLTGFGGVVYNEMKGVYSNPAEYLELGIYKSLFAGTPYAYDAGGVPESIASLSYEKFLEYYAKHYRADNCYFYLYGDLDIDRALEHISEYLPGTPPRPETAYQAVVREPQPVEVYAPADHGYASLSYAVSVPDAKFAMGLWILYYYLLGTPSSPLRRRITELKLASELEEHINMDIPEPVVSIVLKDSQVAPERLKEVVNEVLEGIVSAGVDAELMTACLNKLEFGLREGNYGTRPRGLAYNIELMRSWLYGGAVFERVQWKANFASIRADFGYFTELINAVFLNNPRCVCGRLIPKEYDREREKIAELSRSLTAADIALAKADRALLEAYSLTADTPETLAQIPLLKVSDINNRPDIARPRRRDYLLYTPLATNGIVYAQMYFDTSKVAAECLPYIGMLSYLLTKLPTAGYGLGELTAAIGRDLGGLSAAARVFDSGGEYLPTLAIMSKALAANGGKMFEYALELMRTRFDDKEELRSLLTEYLSRLEKAFVNDGRTLAVMRVRSRFNAADAYEGHTAGFEFYQFLKRLMSDFDGGFDEFIRGITDTAARIFARENLTLAISCDEGGLDALEPHIGAFADSLESPSLPALRHTLKPPCASEGFATKSRVQYVAKGFRYSPVDYSGRLIVLASAIDREYLMNEVRIKGGAYGGNCSVSRRGYMYFHSYRDPHLKRTIDVYDKAFEYLKTPLDTREVRKLVLGAANRYIRPMHPYERFSFAVTAYLNGLTPEDFIAEFDEVLQVTPEGIAALAAELAANNADTALCVVGAGDAVRGNKGLFERVVEV